MTEFLGSLVDDVGLVLLGLAVAALLVLAYIGWVLWRSRASARTEDDDAEDEAAQPGAMAAVGQVAELELSFRRAMKDLKAASTGPGYRYRVPWFLALGPTGSGTADMLREVPLPRRSETHHDDDAQTRSCRWHLFDGGVVVEAAGNLVLKADHGYDELAWRRLLGLLQRYRAERPIDGVVLTLSAFDLYTWRDRPESELRDVGTGLYRRLRELQSELGVRFPVYVVLTDAERLPGFSAFVSAVPRRFHQDAFGWSSPYALDAAFRDDWVDEAFDRIGQRLRDRGTEVLAAQAFVEDADAVFRFPEIAPKLVPAARVVLDEVFAESAYHEGFFLRGIYLTGRVETSATPALLDPDAADAAPQVESGYRHVFLGKLFQRKIFPEAGLARGFQRGVLDRNRTIRWLQIAAAVLLVVGLPGLWMAHGRLAREAAPLEELLDSVHTDLRVVSVQPRAPADRTQRDRETAVHSLLQQMADIDAGPFWSVFMPTSWFSDLSDQIALNLTEGFQQMVLPTLRRGIVEWADTLADPVWASTLGGRVEGAGVPGAVRTTDRLQEYEVLVGYLSELRQFADNAQRFNQISQAESDAMQAFAELFDWYYEEELPDAFFEGHAFYRAALRGASEQPVSRSDWPGFETAAAEVALALTDRFYWRLEQAIGGLEASVAGTMNPAFGASDLRQLWLDVGQVHDLLTSADSAWFDSDAPIVPSVQVMLDSLPNDRMFSRTEFVSRYADGFFQLRDQQIGVLAERLELLSESFYASSASGGVRLDLAPQLASLRTTLGDLLQREFMAPVGDVVTARPPGLAGRPTWNLGPLEEGQRYFGEYQAFRTASMEGVPTQMRGLVQQVAARALDDKVRSTLARAMTFEVGVDPEGRAGREEDLRRRLQGFDAAARRLVSMLEVDATLGGTGAGDAVSEVMILEGTDLLGQVDRLLEESRLYRPDNGNLAAWQAAGPASFAGFGVASADALEVYLTRQRTSLRELSRYAAPVLAYLALDPVADLLRTEGASLAPSTAALVQKWRGIVRTLDDYENKVPGNDLEALEQFVRTDMAVRSLAGCPVDPLGRPAAAEYFRTQQARLSVLLVDRCRQIARQAFLADYERMLTFFSTRLAGRFPFADLVERPGAPDADVESVRQFLRLYDGLAEVVDQSGSTVLDGLLAGAVSSDFLDGVEEVRAFLSPLLFPAEGTGPGSLAFEAHLRTNSDAEVGADQIVDWRLGVGPQSVTYRGDGLSGRGRWLFGEPVEMTLVWASESPRRPVPDPTRPDLLVDGSAAQWRYAGPWSLLRLVAANRPGTAALTGAPRDDRPTVNLRAFTRSRDATREADGSRGIEASVFLRLEFSAAPDGAALVYPRFPVRAPGP